jgi:hypothetical protein
MSAKKTEHDFGDQKYLLVQDSRTLINVEFFRWGYREVIFSNAMVFLPRMGSLRQKFSAFNFWH